MVGESGYNMFFGAEFEQQVEEERAKLSYSKEEGCYIYKQELDPLAIAETYQIDYITIDDEAGNSNTYYLENGVLADFEDNVISNAQFTVVETEAQDSDAKGPAAQYLSRENVQVYMFPFLSMLIASIALELC